MSFEIRKAERKNLPARVGFVGPSGSGKTYSAIHFARGLVGPKGLIVVLDTEQGSSEMYSDKAGGFSVLELTPPYSPKHYMEALDFIEASEAWKAAKPSERVIVSDQISHAWAGEGGVLEYVDAQRTSSGKSEGFAAWKKGTPIQQAFIERMLRVDGHLIVTMRSKTEWVLEKNEKGQTVPRKIGLAPVQRNDIEYEFQVVFEVEQDSHQARASKDRTSLFADRVNVVDIQHGQALAKFFSAGKDLAPQAPAPTGAEPIAAEQVSTLVNAAKVAGRKKEEFLDIVERVTKQRDPRAVKASEFAGVLEALSAPKATSALDELA